MWAFRVRIYISGPGPFDKYRGLCEMAAEAWSAVALEALVRIVAVVPDRLAHKYANRTDWIRRILIRGGHAGQVAAQLYGTVTGQVRGSVV